MKRAFLSCLTFLVACAFFGTPNYVAARELPWQESYFFPIGAWCMPTNDTEGELDYINGTGKTSAYWDPPDYSKMLDHKLDYGRVALRMTNRLYINYYNIINSVYI